MTVKHQPATLLPWQTEQDLGRVDIAGAQGQHIFLGRGAIDPTSTRNAAQDADYAVHAANAYPKLIAALHWYAGTPDGGGVARDLLRELGEGA